MTAGAILKQRYAWSTYALLSSECSLEEKVRADGASWIAGMAVRILDVDVAEAASVLKRLPEPKLQGYYNLWPRIIYEFSDLVGQEPRPMRVLPSPAAISRMEETLT